MNSEPSDPMDASLAQLERELQSLTPAAPPRALVRSLTERMEPAVPIARSVHSTKVHVFPWRRMVAPAAAAAAAVAVMNIESNRRSPAAATTKSTATPPEDAPPAIKWEPMPMRSEYRTLLNNGYVLNENRVPVQELLMNRLDHHEWRNPTDNSSIRLTIPHPQRVTIPADYSTEEQQEAKRLLRYQ